MPDLITHAAAVLLPAWLIGGRRELRGLPLLVAGTLLPDVLSRVPAILTGELHNRLHPLPAPLLYGFDPLHQPVGMALAALGLGALMPPAGRGRATGLLWAGMMLHLLLDLFQFHEGAGHLLLFPFSERTFEIGLFGSEASVFVAGPLALLCLLVGGLRRRARRRPSPVEPPRSPS